MKLNYASMSDSAIHQYLCHGPGHDYRESRGETVRPTPEERSLVELFQNWKPAGATTK
jgi:hypothetical protein